MGPDRLKVLAKLCDTVAVTTEGDLVRLGKAVRARRDELRWSQSEAAWHAGVSDQTWLTVEKGGVTSKRTLTAVERALSWPFGSVDAILEGREPPPAPPPGGADRDAEWKDTLDLLRADIGELIDKVDELLTGDRSDRRPGGRSRQAR